MVVPAIAILGLALIPYLDREREAAGVYLSGGRGRAGGVAEPRLRGHHGRPRGRDSRPLRLAAHLVPVDLADLDHPGQSRHAPDRRLRALVALDPEEERLDPPVGDRAVHLLRHRFRDPDLRRLGAPRAQLGLLLEPRELAGPLRDANVPEESR